MYTGASWGNIKNSKIEDIFNHPDRLQLQDDMKNYRWNPGCSSCENSERTKGHSIRKNTFSTTVHKQSIQYLEYNGSNVCNLTCVMCNPFFSSSWVDFNKKYYLIRSSPELFSDSTIKGPKINFVKEYFKTIDLTNLKTLMLKGGEPFLNKENNILLKHLDDLGILKNITINLNTNGTVLNDEMLDLLAKADKLYVTISKDGPNELNRWIRWSESNPSLSTDSNIKSNIEKILTLPNIKILRNTFALQVYNVFRLEEHINWWETEIVSLSNVVSKIRSLNYFVYTENLNLRVLSDTTRQKLIKKYTDLNNPVMFSPVLKQLSLPYAGNVEHNNFVRYTIGTDKTRDISITEIVPELMPELQLIT